MSAGVEAERVELGKVVGVHGLDGWLKLYSYCDPREQIFEFGPLIFGNTLIEHFEGKVHGKGLLVRLADHPDRTSVEQFVGDAVWVNRTSLPPLEAGEYYWNELLGLTVLDTQGQELGQVDRVVETGANDVLVVKGRQNTLIPYVFDRYILEVDLAAGRMIVDWSADWL